MLSPFECLCGNFILPEPASYVFFYAIFNLRKLLYIILGVFPLPVLVLKERLYLQEQDAGKGLYRSCWRFALRISARTAPSFMLTMP